MTLFVLGMLCGSVVGALVAAYLAYRDTDEMRRELDGTRLLLRWLLTAQDSEAQTTTPPPQWYDGVYVEQNGTRIVH